MMWSNELSVTSFLYPCSSLLHSRIGGIKVQQRLFWAFKALPAVAVSKIIRNISTKIPIIIPASQVSWGWWHTWCILKFSKWQSALGQRTGDHIHGTMDGPSGKCHRQLISVHFWVVPSICWEIVRIISILQEHACECPAAKELGAKPRHSHEIVEVLRVLEDGDYAAAAVPVSRYRAFVNKQQPQLPTQIEHSH